MGKEFLKFTYNLCYLVVQHILFGTESEKSITTKCHSSSILQQPSSPANEIVIISLKQLIFFKKIPLKHMLPESSRAT